MRAITLVAIAQSISMEIDVIGVGQVISHDNRWVAQVEATYGGQTHTVQGEGASAEGAQMHTLALAVKAALPKAVLDELLELEKEDIK